jgi:hypothetical protein
MLNTLLYLVAAVLGLFAFDMAFTNHMAAASLMVSMSAVLFITLIKES